MLPLPDLIPSVLDEPLLNSLLRPRERISLPLQRCERELREEREEEEVRDREGQGEERSDQPPPTNSNQSIHSSPCELGKRWEGGGQCNGGERGKGERRKEEGPDS